jgi:hypothetical protein
VRSFRPFGAACTKPAADDFHLSADVHQALRKSVFSTDIAKSSD